MQRHIPCADILYFQAQNAVVKGGGGVGSDTAAYHGITEGSRSPTEVFSHAITRCLWRAADPPLIPTRPCWPPQDCPNPCLNLWPQYLVFQMPSHKRLVRHKGYTDMHWKQVIYDSRNILVLVVSIVVSNSFVDLSCSKSVHMRLYSVGF